MNYNDYLKKCSVLTESEFNDVISLFPEVDEVDVNIDEYTGNDLDNICVEICNGFLADNFWHAYCDTADYANRTLVIEDVNSLKDLEEIKNALSKWTITNYDELVEEIEENDPDSERNSLIEKIRSLSIEKLRGIVEMYYE